MKRAAAFLLPLVFAACTDQAPTTPSAAPASPSFARDGLGAQGEFTFTTIAVPNARATSASGINARGDIVGSYTDAAGTVHGYLLRDGAFTTIDFPDAPDADVVATDARGIAPGGEIVGTYRLEVDAVAGDPAPKIRGFMRTRQGEFVPVMFRDHKSTIAQRILPDGTILGCRHDLDTMDSMVGVVIGRSDSSEIAVPASMHNVSGTMHNGATPDLERIVGLYTNMMVGSGRQEGYVIENGVFTPLLVPGSTFTQAWDVNPDGEIVGVYRNSAGFHGFVLTQTGYVSIDVPGAAETRAGGINARGDVVGRFVSLADGRTRGFVARRHR